VSEYPEHDKLHEVRDATQAAGEFTEWLSSQGIFLARYHEGHNFPRSVETPVQDLLARWTGIDQSKLEAEKRAMLAKIRQDPEVAR
jgi:hypothetical protein